MFNLSSYTYSTDTQQRHYDNLVLCMLQSGLTSLHLAAQEDRVSAAEVLAKHDANVDQQTKVQSPRCTM